MEVLPYTFGLSKSMLLFEITFGFLNTWGSSTTFVSSASTLPFEIILGPSHDDDESTFGSLKNWGPSKSLLSLEPSYW